MKNLYTYQKFDLTAFFAGKTFIAGAMNPIAEKFVKDGYIYSLKAIITGDPKNEGINVTETINIKLKERPDINPGTPFTFDAGENQMVLTNPIASVWGDYRNKLSIKADKISVKTVSRNN